jgi:DNA polymerase/3'-5' exonuclease PolX
MALLAPPPALPVKPRFAAHEALAVAREVCNALRPACERLIVAGSLRRRRLMVGDVEILFIPKLVEVPGDLFTKAHASLADDALGHLLASGVLAKRRNTNGSEMWGDKNKLAVHVASGIPVDLFAATDSNWFNYLVCRTGPGESNIAIASAAKRMGWQWHPYGRGFSNLRTGDGATVKSERDVFEFVGLPYREPWER